MKTTRMLAILVLALGLATVSLATEGIWTRKADMPTARWGLSTCVVYGKIYAIGGGQIIYGVTQLPTLEEYDPATDTWTKKADMPTGRAFAGASVVNGKIYVIGGSPRAETDTPAVEEYDPATDTWTRKADMPTARCFLSTSVVNGKIYAIGGRMYPGGDTAAVEEYDPVTDTWTRRGNMPTVRTGLSTSVIDGRIYAIGGVAGGLTAPALVRVEEYDPAMDTWTRKADMPTARAYLSTCVANGKIYAIGGTPSNWTPVISTVEEYDPVMDTWTNKPDMPTARQFPSTSVVAGKIYAIGGSVVYWPWTPTSTVEEYDPNPLIVDFNGDGAVDCADMCIMVDHWHTAEPLYDIAPRPVGDGIVDVQDLILLSEHLFEEILPTELIAYWKLDEIEGSIAYDSAGAHDGTVHGNPLWQPAGGQIDGTLAFDGTDDYVSTDFVLNPADGPFSVFAWIKEGAPGQVILSQIGGANWLLADPSDGKLMTSLLRPGGGRTAPQPLISEFIITDGAWHRVGFVWDGSNRTLYVDGVAVAEDPQDSLEGSINGLYMGAGNSLDAASFFSGLIDDIRIYDRAITP